MNRLELSARSRVRAGRLEEFKRVAAEFVRQTKQKDTRTLRFDWFLSADGAESEVREEYLDPQGFVEHKANTAEVTQKLFPELATDHAVAVFGDPPLTLVEKVKQTPMGKTVRWFHFFQGFGAEPVSYWSGTPDAGRKPGLEVGARMTVRADQADGFRRQAAEMLRLVRENDTGTLRYDWFISEDGGECEVREAYVDVQGLIDHTANVSRARDLLFEKFADDHFMTAYDEPTPQLLDLVRAAGMEGRFRWFSLLEGLGDPRTAQAVASA